MDNNIIHVTLHVLRICEYIVHHPLNGCSWIPQSKRHHLELVFSVLTYEGLHFFARLFHFNLPVTLEQVNSCEHSATLNFIEYFVYSWYWPKTSLHLCVEAVIIDTELGTTVFLRHQHDGWCPLRLHRSYDSSVQHPLDFFLDRLVTSWNKTPQPLEDKLIWGELKLMVNLTL